MRTASEDGEMRRRRVTRYRVSIRIGVRPAALRHAHRQRGRWVGTTISTGFVLVVVVVVIIIITIIITINSITPACQPPPLRPLTRGSGAGVVALCAEFLIEHVKPPSQDPLLEWMRQVGE
jgi:hypothetical protein